MAFKNSKLGVVAYYGGWSMWLYRADTEESLNEVLGDGYFNNTVTLMNSGDVIIINHNNETAIRVININNDRVVSLSKPI